MEYKIPGFQKYTIDDELVVRSYSQTSGPIIMSNHGKYGCVRLLPDGGCRNDKRDISVTKLYYCAKAGVNPLYIDLHRHQLYMFNGKVLTKEEYFSEVKHKNQRLSPKSVPRMDEQIANIDKAIETLKAERNAIVTGDWSEVVDIVYGYEKEVSHYLMGRFSTSEKTSEFIFKLACDDLISRLSERGYHYGNLRKMIYSLSRIKYNEHKNAHISLKDFHEMVAIKKQQLDL